MTVEATGVETVTTVQPTAVELATQTSETITRVTETTQEPVVETKKETLSLTKEKATKLAGLLEQAGLVPTDVTKSVTANGGEVSDELRTKLTEQHGEAVADLIIGQLQGLHKETVAKVQERDKAVFDQVQEAFKDITEQSGEETWRELATWAKTNVPNEERNELNKMIQAGGLQTKLAITYLVDTFKTSNDYEQPAQLEEAQSNNAPKGLGPIDRATYQRELKALEAKGHVYGQSKEMATLDARRNAGIARGM